MKKTLKTFLLLAAFSYVIQCNINCAAGVIAAAFIPLIGAAQWWNTKDPTKQDIFFFNVTAANSNTSDFKGNEQLPGVAVPLNFTGSFTNHDMHFRYDAGASKKGTYNGYVNDSSTVITLTSDSLPPLTLRKL